MKEKIFALAAIAAIACLSIRCIALGIATNRLKNAVQTLQFEAQTLRSELDAKAAAMDALEAHLTTLDTIHTETQETLSDVSDICEKSSDVHRYMQTPTPDALRDLLVKRLCNDAAP